MGLLDENIVSISESRLNYWHGLKNCFHYTDFSNIIHSFLSDYNLPLLHSLRESCPGKIYLVLDASWDTINPKIYRVYFLKKTSNVEESGAVYIKPSNSNSIGIKILTDYSKTLRGFCQSQRLRLLNKNRSYNIFIYEMTLESLWLYEMIQNNVK